LAKSAREPRLALAAAVGIEARRTTAKGTLVTEMSDKSVKPAEAGARPAKKEEG